MNSFEHGLRWAACCLPALFCLRTANAQMPFYGDYYLHDPGTMIKDGNRCNIFRTSQGIMGRYSADLRDWTFSRQVFSGKPPAWCWSKSNLHSKSHRWQTAELHYL